MECERLPAERADNHFLGKPVYDRHLTDPPTLHHQNSLRNAHSLGYVLTYVLRTCVRTGTYLRTGTGTGTTT